MNAIMENTPLPSQETVKAGPVHHDMIYAKSSGAGISAVAIIRVSGGLVTDLIEALTRKPCPQPRYAMLATFYELAPDHSSDHANIIDRGLLLYFAAPNSFTGEDMAEFHIHGGESCQKDFMAELAKFPKCRPAEPGEFTKRAFWNGKMDMVRVEGLADLIHAQSRAQRKQAAAQSFGALSNQCHNWLSMLIKMRANMEALIDFSDEELPEQIETQLNDQAGALRIAINNSIIDSKKAVKLREGLKLAIIGTPNSGKSTLLNHLSNEKLALVTEHAGTTRDLIRSHLEIAGVPVTIIDSAGIRNTADPIEQQGIALSHDLLSKADIAIIMTSIAESESVNLDLGKMSADQHQTPNPIRVINKIDLNPEYRKNDQFDHYISLVTQDNVDGLQQDLESRVRAIAHIADMPQFSRQRQINIIQKIIDALDGFQESAHDDYGVRAEYLRIASDLMGRLLGRIDIEQILDKLFNEFCIGK